MFIRSTAAPSSIRTGGWLLAAAILLALRFPHLTGPLDDPHSWRQCDTAHYSLDFYRRGIHLLSPAVCWMGAHRTVILEFPITEALISLFYRMSGPDVLWDRLTALAFFLTATAYLHALVRMLAGRRAAWLATLAYLAFPLGQFYSRSAHVDFAATAFGHAMLYHGLKGLRSRSAAQAVFATLAGTIAVMIKAPSAMPLFFGFAIAVASTRTRSTWVPALCVLGIPAVLFGLWWRHVEHVNQLAPDWWFLPGYYKGAQPPGWYFGTLGMRLDPANWILLARRVVLEIVTPIGALIALVGLAWRSSMRVEAVPSEHEPSTAGAESTGSPSGAISGLGFALVWVCGALLYLTTFFQLNLIHNYYQIPLLAPLAFWVGLGGDVMIERMPRIGRFSTGAVAFAAFLLLTAWMPARLGYYRVDWLRVTAGRLVGERVPRGDLIVASDHGSGFTDPRLLFRADREGWSLAVPDLEPERLRRLKSLGARWVAVVTDPDHPSLAPPGFLEPLRAEHVPVTHAGRAIGMLDLYDLNGPGAAAATGGAP